MQEICIDLLLPEGFDITGIDFKRKVLQMDGQLYPEDLVQAQYGPFYLTQGPVPGFVLPLLPRDLQKTNWQCISIVHQDDELADDPVKLKDAYLKDGVLFALLSKMTEPAGRWILIFTTECEVPTEMIAGVLDSAIEKIKESLELDKSFMMYHDSTGVPTV